MLDCTTPKYELLYRRWLAKPGDLLDRGGFQPGMRVLDLCGGTGVVAVEALRRSAEMAVVFDLAPRSPALPDLHPVAGDAERLTAFLPPFLRRFNLIVCRQALAYLDLDLALPEIRRCLAVGGRFVANTFRRPRWGLRTYRLDGRRYLEASGFAGRRVLHVQAALPGGLDLSSFRWSTREELERAFESSGFRTEITETDKTIYLVARRA